MKRILFWWLVLVLPLCIVPDSFASTIERATVTATVMPSAIDVSSEYIITSENIEDLILTIPQDVNRLVLSMNGVNRTCKLEAQKEEQIARCGSTRIGTNTIVTRYTTQELAGDLGAQQLIKYSEKLPYKTSEYEFNLKLPEGYIIPRENKRDFYLSPDPDQIWSDGQRIIITWNSRELTRFSTTAIVQPLEDNTWLFIILGLGAIATIGTVGIILGIRKTKPQDVVPSFIDAEKQVVTLLQNAPNQELWQKQIQQECNFSKAKLSRIIRNLESRSVIIKEPHGNTNKILLKNGSSAEPEQH